MCFFYNLTGGVMNEQDVQGGYQPNRLLDTLIKDLHLKNDAALCRTLQIGPPLISKIRHGRLPVSASILIRMHETTGRSIRELRQVLGDRRAKYRFGDIMGKPKTTKAEQNSEPRSADSSPSA
jgi:transcriptional regulator with XRE-family HTH domain